MLFYFNSSPSELYQDEISSSVSQVDDFPPLFPAPKQGFPIFQLCWSFQLKSEEGGSQTPVQGSPSLQQIGPRFLEELKQKSLKFIKGSSGAHLQT